MQKGKQALNRRTGGRKGGRENEGEIDEGRLGS